MLCANCNGTGWTYTHFVRAPHGELIGRGQRYVCDLCGSGCERNPDGDDLCEMCAASLEAASPATDISEIEEWPERGSW